MYLTNSDGSSLIKQSSRILNSQSAIERTIRIDKKCVEMVDCETYGKMRKNVTIESHDVFITTLQVKFYCKTGDRQWQVPESFKC